jgi:hypothetical protein
VWWQQWQAENPGKELRPAEAFMAALAAGDRARADAIATDVVHELEGTPDVGKVEWWFRNEIEKAWPPKKEPSFHKTDKAGGREKPELTIEEREPLIAELVQIRRRQPLEYSKKKRELAERLGETQDTVHKMVMAQERLEPKGDEDHEQSQATKLMAIGLGFRLWHSPDGDGFASVEVGGHLENYRIMSSAFEKLMLAKYGEKYRSKIGDGLYPQIPSDSGMRAGLKGLTAVAVHQGGEFVPAVRVGGCKGAVWLDLGRDDWKVVKITKEGWSIVSGVADVAFVRTGTLRPLPLPVKDGNNSSPSASVERERRGFCVSGRMVAASLEPKGTISNRVCEWPGRNGKDHNNQEYAADS